MANILNPITLDSNAVSIDEFKILSLVGETIGLLQGQQVTITVTHVVTGEQVTALAWVNAEGHFEINNMDLNDLVDGNLLIQASTMINGVDVLSEAVAYEMDADISALSLEWHFHPDSGLVDILGVAADVLAGTDVAVTVTDSIGQTFTALATVNADGSFELIDLDLSMLEPGEVTIDVTATDNNGHPLSHAIGAELTQTSGTVELTLAVAQGDVQGITISGMLSGLPAGTVIYISITDDDANQKNMTVVAQANGSFDLTNIDTSMFTNHHLTVSAVAVSGNLSGSALLEYQLPNTVAELTIEDATFGDDLLLDVFGMSSGLDTGTVVTISIQDSNGHFQQVTATVQADGKYSALNIDVPDMDEGTLHVTATVNDNNNLVESQNAWEVELVRNHAPQGADKLIDATEDVGYIITAADLGFSDEDSHNLTGVKITSLPAQGTLKLGDVSVTLNQVISKADLNAGNLKFQGQLNANGSNYASLKFAVQDSGTTHNEDLTPNTLNFNVAAVNDAPVLSNPIATQTAGYNTGFSFTVPANTFSDVDSAILSYSATLADGSALPSWLSFNASTRQFTGTPLATNDLSLKVIASDGVLSATSTFQLVMPPAIKTVALSGATGIQNNTLNAGDVVTATVTFTENVTVTGTPKLALNIGGTLVNATYVSGTGSTQLTFSYAILTNQNDANGIRIETNALVLNGGTIADGSGNAAVLAMPAVIDNANYAVDTTAPTIGTLSITDTGASTSDGITNNGTVTVGSLEAGAIWEYSTNGGTTWSTGTGTSFTLPAATYAANAIQMRETDKAGNVQTGTLIAKITTAVTVDTTAPTTPGLAGTDDVGLFQGTITVSGQTDDTKPTFSGSAEAGSLVKVYDGTTLLGTATASATGTWSFIPATALSVGAHSVTATATDVAGNTSPATSALAFTVDTTAPATTLLSVALSNDTGTSNTDFITSVASQTLSGSLSANLATGEKVMVSLDNGSTWTAATGTVGSTAWSLSGATLNAGNNTLLAKVVDAAGNGGTALSKAYSYVAVSDFTVGITRIEDNAGTATNVLSGGTSNDTTPTLVGTLGGATQGAALTANEVVNVYRTPNLAAATVVQAGTLTNAQLLSGNPLTLYVNGDGNYTDTVLLPKTPADGDMVVINKGSSWGITIYAGTTAIDFVGGTDNRYFKWSDAKGQWLTGTNALTKVGNATVTTVASGQSTWAITDNTGLGNSDSVIYIAQVENTTGVFGQQSTPNAFDWRYNVDNVAPSAITLIGTDDVGPVTGTISNNAVTNDNKLTFSGTTEANATVNVYDGTTLLGSTTANASGAWSFTPATALSQASHSVTAKATDGYGNTSAASTALAFTVDTTAPVAVIDAVTLTEDFVTSTGNVSTNDTSLQGGEVYALVGGDASGNRSGTYAGLHMNSNGSYTLSPNTATIHAITADVTEKFTYNVTDAAGNTSQNTLTFTFTPVNDAAVIGGTSTGAVTEAGGVTNAIAGTAKATGTLTSTDVDGTDNAFIAVTAGAATTKGYGTFGMMAAGLWTYTLNNSNATVQALAASDTLTDTFAVSAADGTSKTVTVTITGANDAPVVAAAIADQSAILGTAFSYTLPSGAFSDVDSTLTYTVSRGDGSVLPAWLTFDAATRTFSGTPTSTVDFNIKVTASDGAASISDTFLMSLPTVATSADITDSTGIQSDYLNAGDTITATVNFSELVNVTGTPQLTLNIGGTLVKANYVSGSGSTALAFSYTILDGQTDADGISINANSLGLNGGTIKDPVGNNATQNFSASADNVSFMVDTTAPPIGTLSFTDTGSSTTDGITKNGLITVGSLEAGATWQYSKDSGATWTTGTGTSFTLAAGTYAAGSVQMRETDKAGNVQSGALIAKNAAAITVDATAPVAVADTVTGTEDALTLAGNVSTNDTSKDGTETYALVGSGTGSYGTLTLNADGTYSYARTSNLDAIQITAVDSFTYQITDTAGNSSQATLSVKMTPVNDAPYLANAIADQVTSLSSAFSYVVPADAFIDPDSTLTYSATKADGSALPTWLTFNTATRTFSGTPTAIGNLNLLVKASDGTTTLSDAFMLSVGDGSGSGINLSTIAAGVGGFIIDGSSASAYSGYSVSAAGDVNGDGLDDMLVSGFGTTGTTASITYVVFGKTNLAPVKLSALGTQGFEIRQEQASDKLGQSVSAAGDINGDGLADLLVSANEFDPTSARYDAGRSYVVFGKASNTAVQLSSVSGGAGGYAINGSSSQDFSGYSLSSAGDVNGDGLADVIIGAYKANAGTVLDVGMSYVVYGKTGSATPIELSALGTGGLVLKGTAASDYSGWSVSAAGDVNGDGFADVLVGAHQADPNGTSSGRTYVVFGKAGGGAIDLSAINNGVGGYAIQGERAGDQSGYSVSSAGDVNGDGLADVIVGAPYGDSSGLFNDGRSFVVFGKTSGTAVQLTAVSGGVGGFAVRGTASNTNIATSVSSAGDINGDGLADLLVGAPEVTLSTSAGYRTGQSYVVYGKASGVEVTVSTGMAGSLGFAISGEGYQDLTGRIVSTAGDVNGDGLADLMLSAATRAVDGFSLAGRTYVILGSTGGAFKTAVDVMGTAGDDTLNSSGTQTLIAAAGNDTLVANGADVLYGGSGKDVFVLGPSTISALGNVLGAAGNTGQLARVVGGTGFDAIRLTGGANLDLTQISNSAAGSQVDGTTGSRIDGIECIVMGNDAAANTLTLTARDVKDMAGFNVIHTGTASADGNVWTNTTGTALNAMTSYHQLVVNGTNIDSVVLSPDSGFWANAGTVSNGASSYTVYQNTDNLTQLLVKSGVGVTNNDPEPFAGGQVTSNGISMTLDSAFVENGKTYWVVTGYSGVIYTDLVNGPNAKHDVLDTIFNNGQDTTDTNRSFVSGGHTFILPTKTELIDMVLNPFPTGLYNGGYWSATLSSPGAHELVQIYHNTSTALGDRATNSPVIVQVLPVVIDLNRDGMLSYGQVNMDVNSDGLLDATKWAGAQDGVLVWDKYQDGQVHNNTQYAFAQYAMQLHTDALGNAHAATDLEGLADGFDTNHDGVFNAQDAKFAEFKVWQDLNQNGVSDAGEVRSLADWGLTAINLVSDGVVRTPAAGVTEAGQTSATTTDGTSMLVADAAFAYGALSYSLNGTQLNLLGSGMNLDLSGFVAQQGTVTSANIDGSGSNILKLDLADLLQGHAAGTALRVQGGSDDTLALFHAEGWSSYSTVVDAGVSYNLWQHAGSAQQLLVDPHLQVTMA